jgi:hypothetical protein
MTPRPAPWSRLHFGLLVVVCGVGCSSGRYDADYAQRLTAYHADAAFAGLNRQATTLPGTRLGLRLPRQLFTPVSDEQADRLTPPFLRQFPGRVATYEAMLEANGTRLPASLTVGVVPRADRHVGDVEKAVLEQVRADESFPKVSFRKGVAIQPVAGGPATWHAISLRGEQLFEGVVAGNPESKRRPGACEIWISADPKQEFCTVLAVRVPDDVAGQLTLPPAELAELVARTVEIAPPEAAPSGT